VSNTSSPFSSPISPLNHHHYYNHCHSHNSFHHFHQHHHNPSPVGLHSHSRFVCENSRWVSTATQQTNKHKQIRRCGDRVNGQDGAKRVDWARRYRSHYILDRVRSRFAYLYLSCASARVRERVGVRVKGSCVSTCVSVRLRERARARRIVSSRVCECKSESASCPRAFVLCG
jgi:hypothetical protein